MSNGPKSSKKRHFENHHGNTMYHISPNVHSEPGVELSRPISIDFECGFRCVTTPSHYKCMEATE